MPMLLLASCSGVDLRSQEVSETPPETLVASFPEVVLPEGWFVTEENESYIRMEGAQFFVTLSYQEPQLANGLDDYDYLGVTEAGSNVFETYSRLIGPAEPQLLYALVMESKELYVELGYGEKAIQDEDVISILSSLTY